MGELNIYNISGKVVDVINIDPVICDYEPKKQAVHDVVVAYLANQRTGTACTKTRNEISGSTKKPWKQKGTGRARIGTRSSPVWRGGGTVFGPKPREFRIDVPKDVKKVALHSVIADKLQSNSIYVVDKIEIAEAKTKKVIELIQNVGVTGKKVLFVTSGINLNLLCSARNIPYVNVVNAIDVNTYELLNCVDIIIEKDALEVIKNRIVK